MKWDTQIKLKYVIIVNGVELPDRLLELWTHFQKVRFHYSIDSIGAMNDYIRYPSEWDHQLKMFERLDQKDI